MKFWLFLVLVGLIVVGCSESGKNLENATKENSEVASETIVKPTISDTSLELHAGDFEVDVRVIMPKEDYRGTILVLQGWNFPNTSWSDSSDIEYQASDAGFALVMPDMGKSIYHKKVYQQTRKDWRKYPTRTWLVDTLLKSLNDDYSLFQKHGNNFVMGLSTGGRGAFIIAQENPDIFKAGASLSGDYDQEAFPEDNLYRGYFGSSPDKWNPEENPVNYADKWSVPMFFSHGLADSVVSVAHQNRLQQIAKKQGVDENWIFYVSEEYGHNYKFWSREVVPIMDYFLQFTLK